RGGAVLGGVDVATPHEQTLQAGRPHIRRGHPLLRGAEPHRPLVGAGGAVPRRVDLVVLRAVGAAAVGAAGGAGPLGAVFVGQLPMPSVWLTVLKRQMFTKFL